MVLAADKSASRARSGQSASENLSWVGAMIHPSADAGVGQQASFLRRAFAADGSVDASILRISALGLYRCFINGRRVGDDQLTPGWTSYSDRLSFQTYDVSDLLEAGENVIEIWLGDGWYRSQMMWRDNALYNTWGDKIGAIAEIRSGVDVLVATDTNWQSGLAPILKSGIYFGEIYDARLEGLPADKGSEVISSFNVNVLVPHEVNGVKELEALSVQRQFRDEQGRTIYDFGQNCGGYVAFEVEGDAGARVIVEHAEVLDKNGHFENANMRTAEARLEYVLMGKGVEAYRPTFTFQGFRFVRVTIDGSAVLKSIVSIPISSAVVTTGAFSSANPLVDRLVENTKWSQRSNFIEVPTDCPQRDERLGWTGDAQVFVGTACYLHESHSFWRKWLRDVMADQRPDGAIPHFSPDPTRLHEDKVPNFYGSTGWGDAICVVPWALWLHYGDRDVLEETLPSMERWVDFVWSISDGPIVSPPRDWGSRGFSFGDWLQPKGPSVKPLPTIGDDAAATIYLYIASRMTADAARVVGNFPLMERMLARAEEVRKAFQKEFITASGRLAYDDQTSYALAIMWDLVPSDLLPAASRYFKATIARSGGRIGTGFIGTPALLPALVKIGEPELAAAVFLQEQVPGWLYQVKTGATTIWERWDAIQADGSVFDPGMNSYNHYAYGAVCQWLFEAVAGFRPDPENPGFETVIFEPVIIPELSPVRANHDSIKGAIGAGWQVNGNRVTYDVMVPAGATGIIVLGPQYGRPMLNGQAVSATADKDGKVHIPLTAGQHQATFEIAQHQNPNGSGNGMPSAPKVEAGWESL